MFKSTLKNKSSINIIPMIDVIFFLLVFFMLFTTFRANPTGIELQLPKAVTVSDQEKENMILDVNTSGNVFYNDDEITLSELKDIAARTYRENNEVVVIINADRDVKYKYIIAVMDNIRQVGIYNLALAAEKEG